MHIPKYFPGQVLRGGKVGWSFPANGDMMVLRHDAIMPAKSLAIENSGQVMGARWAKHLS